MDVASALLLLLVLTLIIPAVADLWAGRALHRAASSLTLLERKEAMRLARRAGLLGGGGVWWSAALIESRAASDEGETERAVEIARRMLVFGEEVGLEWDFVNTCVDILINAGHYSEAVGVRARYLAGANHDPELTPVVTINEAEALHNLGRSAEALSLLDATVAGADHYPLAKSGLVCLRAWILIELGRLDEARHDLAAMDTLPLTPSYAAEIDFTWAALELASGNLDKALASARCGLGHSSRASSERNAHFLLAEIAVRRGEVTQARSHFERAVAHRYRGQGGMGLTRYADFLEGLGETTEAERIRLLISKRDPEWRPAATT